MNKKKVILLFLAIIFISLGIYLGMPKRGIFGRCGMERTQIIGK